MQPQHRVPDLAVWRIPAPAMRHDEPRVLIADDLEATRTMCLALDADSTVRAVHTELDAVTLARKWRPGVVLLDLMMPLGDGWEAAEAIRAIDLDYAAARPYEPHGSGGSHACATHGIQRLFRQANGTGTHDRSDAKVFRGGGSRASALSAAVPANVRLNRSTRYA